MSKKRETKRIRKIAIDLDPKGDAAERRAGTGGNRKKNFTGGLRNF